MYYVDFRVKSIYIGVIALITPTTYRVIELLVIVVNTAN